VADVLFDKIAKIYSNGFRAVDDLSLSIQDGEFLVLVGPSGCGKTTALRMVAGLEEISSGGLFIGGQIVNDLTPKERDIAMIFQNYALYPHLTVSENIEFSLRLRKISRDETRRRVEWAARLLDLAPLLERKPKQLSGGQRQRVAMGRAIVREPQVFLMDEPLSNLDAKLRVQMRADIAKLQNDLGTTTIYVTHDQIEAMTMGDRVAVMRGGVLQQVAAPQALYDEPANLFVAGFIGSPPMNLFEAKVEVSSTVSVSFGGATFNIPAEKLHAYPRLRDHHGQTVVAGIRSKDVHPAADRTDVPKLQGRVELIEALGGETIVYFKSEAISVQTDREIEEVTTTDVNDEGVVSARPNLVVEFPARVSLKIGERVSLSVDVERMHFFDVKSGAPLK
jgi:multiple sugar transport system ATP-binding protein